MQNEFRSFDFWVEEGAFSSGNMYQLNRTYAYLGNVAETSKGTALVAASARDLSPAAPSQPYDLFVQVFDPAANGGDPGSYVTAGTRSGVTSGVDRNHFAPNSSCTRGQVVTFLGRSCNQ